MAINLENVVTNVLNTLFPGTTIHKVLVKPGVDYDGDEVLRITVILDEGPERLDKDALVGLARHLRSRLAEVDHEEFPIVSFVSRNEAKKLKLESV